MTHGSVREPLLCLEIDDHADAGEVQSSVEEVADPSEPVQVVGA